MADVDDWWTAYVVSIPGITGSWVSFMYFGAGIWAVTCVLIRRFPINIPKSARIFVIGCLGYAFTLLFSSILNDGYAGILPGLAAGGAFYFVPFMISRYRFSNPERAFAILIAYAPLGAILCLASALYQSIVVHSTVEGGAGNASVFGFTAVVLGTLSLTNANSNVIEYRLWAIAGFIAGMAALLMSRTRSLYPFVAIAPAVFIYYSFLPAQYRYRITLILAIAAGFVGLLFLYNFQEEIIYIFRDLSKVSRDTVATSFGIRVELWKVAYSEFSTAPWFGHGQIHKMDRVIQGLPEVISYARYTHVHNVWMDTLLSCGAIGFLFVNIIFLSCLQAINFFKSELIFIPIHYSLIIVSIVGIINSTLNTLFTNDIMTVIFLIPNILFYASSKNK